MSSVAEIEVAIEKLPANDQRELRHWFLRREWPGSDEDILVPPDYRQKVLDALDHP